MTSRPFPWKKQSPLRRVLYSVCRVRRKKIITTSSVKKLGGIFDTPSKDTQLMTNDLSYRRYLLCSCIQFLHSTFPGTALVNSLRHSPHRILSAVLHIITPLAHNLHAALTLDQYLFVHISKLTSNDATDLRRFVVTLIELAEEQLRCSNLVMCLDPSEVLLTKALLFVGFEIIGAEVMAHDPNHVRILVYSIQ